MSKKKKQAQREADRAKWANSDDEGGAKDGVEGDDGGGDNGGAGAGGDGGDDGNGEDKDDHWDEWATSKKKKKGKKAEEEKKDEDDTKPAEGAVEAGPDDWNEWDTKKKKKGKKGGKEEEPKAEPLEAKKSDPLDWANEEGDTWGGLSGKKDKKKKVILRRHLGRLTGRNPRMMFWKKLSWTTARPKLIWILALAGTRVSQCMFGREHGDSGLVTLSMSELKVILLPISDWR